MFYVFFFDIVGDPRDLHGPTHSFPTRRSSDLRALGAAPEIDPEAAVDLVLRRKALGHGGAIPFFRAMPARLSRRPCCSGRPRERSCPDSSGGTGRKIRPFRRRAFRANLKGHDRRSSWAGRSEEHTSELQSLMRISYA